MESAEIKIPRTLNEHILGNCNLEFPEEAPEVVGAASVEFAKAVKDRKELEKKTEEDFKEQDKVAKEFVKETTNTELKEDVQEVPEMKLYKRASDLAEQLDDIIAQFSQIEDIDTYLTSSDFNTLNKACEALQDFAVQYSYIMDNEDVFENLEEEEAVKKRTRAPKETPEDKLINQVDTDRDILWARVYDELSSELDDEKSSDVSKEIKARRGDRYEAVYPGPGDYDITVYATNPDDFEFAKKVADHYDVGIGEPKEDRNRGTNSYYKYSITLHV